MKNFFTIVFFFIFSTNLFATTYHTITIDGINDFESDEQFTTTTGNGQTGYVYFTWDANNIYVGYSGNSGSGNIADDNRALFLFIDTDPQTNPLSGNGTNDRGEWSGITGTISFNADFRIVYQTTQTGGSGHNWLPYYWDGSVWATSSIPDNSAESGDNFVEYAISRSSLGNPSQIYICAYSQEQWDGGWIANGIPYNLFTDFQDDNANHDFNSHWLGFTLTSGVSPNSSSNNDSSLPVTLSSFTISIAQNAVVLNWITQSEVDVLGYEIQRASLKEGPYTTIASYQDHPQLRSPGNSSAKREYRYEDEQVLAGQTYWYKLISHDLDGSHQTFGPISVSVKLSKELQPVNGDMPAQFALQQNFPNPFNGGTDIRFAVASKENTPVSVRLSVFNLAGQKVADLIHADLNPGQYALHWDGRDNYGRELPSGVYFYRLSAPGFLQSRKMIFMR